MRWWIVCALVAVLASMFVSVALAETGESTPCSTHAWNYDGGKSIPFENELRVSASDGCHRYELVAVVARDALNGSNSGSGSLIIGDADQSYDAGSTISDPGAVGYCRYAAEHMIHGLFKHYFQVPLGTTVDYTFDCRTPAH